MFNLTDPNISYILISPEKEYYQANQNNILCETACTILYSRNYTIIPISGYLEGKHEKSFLAISPDDDNDTLRFDSIFVMDNNVIIKYRNQSEATQIESNGSEKPLNVTIYDSDLNKKTYIHNGVSFSFTEKKRYFFPKKKEDLKKGMIVEYFNNNKWSQRQIINIETEYEKMFKLLMKYEKLRIECQ